MLTLHALQPQSKRFARLGSSRPSVAAGGGLTPPDVVAAAGGDLTLLDVDVETVGYAKSHAA